MEKLVKYLPYIFGTIYIVILSIFFISYTGGDSTFPVVGDSTNWLKLKFLYLWSSDVYGTTTFIDKLRLAPTYILNEFSLYSKQIFFLLFNLVGFNSFYFSVKIISKNNSDFKSNLLLTILSLLFIFNPLTIFHSNHTFLLQGYFLYPVISVLYFKFLINKNFINPYLFFIVFIPLLGQPHNYYNIVIILIIITLIVFIRYSSNIPLCLLKALIALSFSTLICSYILLPLIFTHPNDLFSSTQNFSHSIPNLVWSRNQGFVNTLVFKLSMFDEFPLLLYITIIINSIILFYIFLKKFNNKNIIILTLVSLISLGFVGKNPLLAPFNNLIYTFLPHLRVDVAYILIIYIPIFYFIIFFIAKQKYLPIKTLLFILLIINTILFLNFYKLDSRDDTKKYINFEKWISNNIDTTISTNTMMLPNQVTYLFPGVNSELYGGIVFDNIINNHSLYHWPFGELMLRNTKQFIYKKFNSYDYINVTNTRYILCFGTDCPEYNDDLILKSSKNDYKIYEFKKFRNVINFEQGIILKRNLTNYSLHIKLKNAGDIVFLQSHHPKWKIYLDPYSELDCQNAQTNSGSFEGKLYSMTECKSKNKFYIGGELAKLWEKPIFDETHTMVYDYANQWTIDPEYIKANYSKEYYKENPDGSIDVRMTLYFKPQSYFYLGLIISFSTLIFLLFYLGYNTVRCKKQGKRRVEIDEKST